MKAFIVNRVGDFGFRAGHLRRASWCSARSQFDAIFAAAPPHGRQDHAVPRRWSSTR